MPQLDRSSTLDDRLRRFAQSPAFQEFEAAHFAKHDPDRAQLAAALEELRKRRGTALPPLADAVQKTEREALQQAAIWNAAAASHMEARAALASEQNALDARESQLQAKLRAIAPACIAEADVILHRARLALLPLMRTADVQKSDPETGHKRLHTETNTPEIAKLVKWLSEAREAGLPALGYGALSATEITSRVDALLLDARQRTDKYLDRETVRLLFDRRAPALS